MIRPHRLQPKTARPPSAFARSLEPIAHLLWPLFIGWSVITAGLWWLGDTWIVAVPNADLRAALAAIVASADAAWLLLGALNLYLDLAAREGLARARSVALAIALAALGVAWASVVTGWPLGSIVYTTRLGARIGPVPIGWLLLWIVAILGSRAFVQRLWPRLSHGGVALVSGTLATTLAVQIDVIAVNVRFYWFWFVAGTTTPSATPLRSFLVWFIATTLFAWFIRERHVASTQPQSTRPALVFAIVNLVIFSGHFIR